VRIYVVNLRRRPDRRASMEATLPADASIVFTSDWDGPFDGTQLDLADLGEFTAYGGWQLPVESGHRYWDRPLLGGEVGCSLSHLHCWHHAIEQSSAEPVVVLEDDVSLEPDFASQVREHFERADAADPDWGLMYLGRSGHVHDTEIDDCFLRPGFSYGSFGYALSARGLRAVVAAGLDRAVIPVDEFLPACYLEHPRPDIRLLFPPRLSALALRRAIVSTDLGLAGDSEQRAKHSAPTSGWA